MSAHHPARNSSSSTFMVVRPTVGLPITLMVSRKITPRRPALRPGKST